MAQPTIRADILGKLLLIQQTLDVLPDNRGIAAYLRRPLGEIPGVTDVHLCVEGEVLPPSDEFDEACAKCEASWSASGTGTECMVGNTSTICIPLRTARRLHGVLILSLGDERAFSSYRSFVQNIANVVATTLETRQYITQLDDARADLEDWVAERTARLQESEEKFRALVEMSSDWVWEVDASGTYTYASPKVEALLGFKPEEVVGKTPFDLMPPEEAQRVASVFMAASQARVPLEQVLNTCLHKDGHVVVLETSGIPIFDALGHFAGYRGVDRDVTERKHAEQALRESEERYRALYADIPSMYFTVDPAGTVLSVNTFGADQLGYTVDELVGGSMLQVFPPDQRAEATAHVAECLARPGEVFTWELRKVRKDGSLLDVRETDCAVRDQQGGLIVLMVCEDISERKQAEEALRESERRYRGLVELSPDAVAVHDGEKLLFVNPAAAKMLGVDDPGKAVGMAVADFVHPDWRPIVAARVREMLREGKTEPLIEEKFQRLDESAIDVEVASMPVMWQGMPAIQVAFRDITERMRAEEALRASEERYRRITETITNYVFTASVQDGRVVSIVHGPSCVAVTGYSSDEMARDPDLWLRMVVAEDRTAVLEQARRILSGQRVDPLEHRIIDKGGRIRWVRNTPVPQFDPDGTLVSYDGLIQDITERRMLQEQLRQSQKMEAVGRLAGGVAHDFNNLLTAINGYADILAAGMGADDGRRADIEEIRKAGERAAALTRQLLAFSRRQVLQPTVIDLNVVVAGIVPMLRRLVGEQIEFRALAAPDLDRVRADPTQIEQVLLNLVVNARDAMPAGGTLTIETANTELDDEYARTHTLVAPGPYVLLAVSDTGVGMDALTMAHLFEPFFTTKALGEGTGLGLATVYGIVAQSGGHVTAYSEPGHGSVFKVFLPRVAETVEPHTPAVAEPAASGAETILLVEDEDVVRSFVERVLGRLGYAVAIARSGAEALALAADHPGPIDLLVTDVMLPGMGGREISERLTALRPSLRTLFISGYTEDSIVHRGELDPGVAFLGKPFTPDALGHAVREVLGAQKDVSGGPPR